MRTLLITFTLFALVLSPLSACENHAHKKTAKTYKLAPKEQKKVSFKADHKTRVAFIAEMTSEERAKCEGDCIRLKYQNKDGSGEAVRSKMNGNLEIPPYKGRVTFTVQNLQDFPIKVIVTWRAQSSEESK